MAKALTHGWPSYLRAARAAGMLGHSKHEDTTFRDQLAHPTQSKVKMVPSECSPWVRQPVPPTVIKQ